MLGFSVYVYGLSTTATSADYDRVRTAPYTDAIDVAKTLTIAPSIRVSSRAWIDHLLDCTESDRAELLQDGGYPYLFRALGADIKENFAGREAEPVASLKDATWYLVEAWDQS